MPANNFLNRPGQRECFTKWRGLALLHNRTGDATRGGFFAEIAKKSGQLFFAVTVDDRIRGFLGAWIHPHVERTVSHQTETAFGIFELAGRNTEIENRSANFTNLSSSSTRSAWRKFAFRKVTRLPNSDRRLVASAIASGS